MDERLTRIETKIGFSEDLLEELNQTVFRQQQRIERLEQALLQLHRQVTDLRPAGARDPVDEIPPHY